MTPVVVDISDRSVLGLDWWVTMISVQSESELFIDPKKYTY